MTAIASSPAPTSAPTPIAPSPALAARQGAGDQSAFTDLLNSLPGGDAKPSSPIAGERERTADDPKRGEPPKAQVDARAARFDGVAMSLSPFVALSAAIPGQRPAAAANAPAPAAASVPAPNAESESAPPAVTADRANLAIGARLVGERAFLSSLSAVGAFAGPSPAAPSTSEMPAAAKTPGPKGEVAPPASSAAIAARARAAAAEREAASGGRKSGTAAPAPSAHVAKPAAADSPKSGDGATGRSPASGPPDSGASRGQASTPASAPGALASAPLPGPTALGLQDPPARAAEAAPRASSSSAGPAPQASRVKEIDLDLSPSGLEDVSMTMRLAGDRLSVVIRAGSSRTYGAIEGARDAIADRLAAIGQPLDSFIIQQTGGNANGDTNANGGSRGDSDGGGAGQSGQRGDPTDPRGARRGASGGSGL